mmetsp:Transcript_30523/g.56396  ORF Transcript_30523/g.56396 Transcript_30523/m.56396 type:complete len:218 (-) Transcript_30523:196-849(-)|eukprot:CAMPEP_0201875864 /NCGR_PEP_ID=MMETSP0902-20130614/7720_1 /ASSEMBLY_ACC=CAM_ASM_000551 /TAXON_ID=420261 /ORGANISM="Thalassiosira antarctica, Strain CCMP982" /LENGTH=217 /DNA_ID=CAMNT_0048402999 /DNA_START=191 /DNA_END=844 /DNA_ORIENTATION=+
MYLTNGRVFAVLAAVFACVSRSEAFTINVPPSQQPMVSVSSIQAQLPNSTPSSSLNLPSQSELLQKASSFSTINLAAAAPVTAVAPATATPTAKPATAVASTAGVSITGVNFDGLEKTTEADEYVVISNGSKAPMDVSGYYVYVATTGTPGPTFTFPKSSTIKPGASVRVYTNEIHKETGGYSYGSGKAIWNNRGGLAVMKDSKGKKVCEFKYTPSA